MVRADHRPEAADIPSCPPVATPEPVAQNHLPGQAVRRAASFDARDLDRHRQAMGSHLVAQNADLNGERRRGLADVVHTCREDTQGACRRLSTGR